VIPRDAEQDFGADGRDPHRAADEITRIETLVARLDVYPPHIPPGRPDRD
jgi:hypothetical protein